MRATGTALRQKILDEATATLRRDGVAGLTMRSLAHRLGYSPATLYLYFDGKDELLDAVARVGFEELSASCAQALNGSTPLEALAAGAKSFLDFADRDPHMHRLMFRPEGAHLEERHRFEETLCQPLRKGVEEGVLRPADLEGLSLAWTAMLRGLAEAETNGQMEAQPVTRDTALASALGLLRP
jgi:AcrR family transcriptional regulator